MNINLLLRIERFTHFVKHKNILLDKAHFHLAGYAITAIFEVQKIHAWSYRSHYNHYEWLLSATYAAEASLSLMTFKIKTKQ